MDKKQTVIFSFLVIVTLGLAAGATYMQQTHSIHVDAAVQKADSQRDSAVAEAKSLEQQNAAIQNTDSLHIKTYQAHQAALCAQLAKAKLVNPICTAK